VAILCQSSHFAPRMTQTRKAHSNTARARKTSHDIIRRRRADHRVRPPCVKTPAPTPHRHRKDGHVQARGGRLFRCDRTPQRRSRRRRRTQCWLVPPGIDPGAVGSGNPAGQESIGSTPDRDGEKDCQKNPARCVVGRRRGFDVSRLSITHSAFLKEMWLRQQSSGFPRFAMVVYILQAKKAPGPKGACVRRVSTPQSLALGGSPNAGNRFYQGTFKRRPRRRR
jgi:hypothetical protein